MARTRLPIFRFAALLAALGVSIALTLGFLGRLHPAFDSFSHFRLHFALLLFLCGIALFGMNYRAHGLAALLLSLGSMATIATYSDFPFLSPVAAESAAPPDQPVYKLLQLNAYYGNRDPKAVIALIAREYPDVITLEEVTDRWRGELDHISAAYPYRLDCRVEKFSTLILSRRPMDKGHNPYCAPNGRIGLAQIDFNGRVIDVMALHLPWPWPSDQTEMIEEHAPLLQLLGETAIAAGDFNAAPWSAAVRKVVEFGGFTRLEHVGPTWIGHHILPAGLKFLGLPIDQVMTKGRIVVHSARTLEPVGSDHLPVLVEFSIAAEEEEQGTQTVRQGLGDDDQSPTNALMRRSILAPSLCSRSSKATCFAS
ncbi:MAG: endonuclease/exonuclease/phosphatase family protein [Rhizobiaceae bacterium]|nr:endonuclease/exonuclease/phosphatase family protein [Rhizobiaceae bacterium]